jgi:hypothetical protein
MSIKLGVHVLILISKESRVLIKMFIYKQRIVCFQTGICLSEAVRKVEIKGDLTISLSVWVKLVVNEISILI